MSIFLLYYQFNPQNAIKIVGNKSHTQRRGFRRTWIATLVQCSRARPSGPRWQWPTIRTHGRRRSAGSLWGPRTCRCEGNPRCWPPCCEAFNKGLVSKLQQASFRFDHELIVNINKRLRYSINGIRFPQGGGCSYVLNEVGKRQHKSLKLITYRFKNTKVR